MSTQTARFEELGRELGEAIAGHPKYEAYEEMKTAVEADDDVQELITEFNQLREKFSVSRQMGETTQEGFRKIQTAQEEFRSKPVMEEYLLAQAELVGESKRINEAISEPLTVDFGGEAGGCYND